MYGDRMFPATYGDVQRALSAKSSLIINYICTYLLKSSPKVSSAWCYSN